MSYERACMATPREEYFTKMLDSLLEHNHRHGIPFSSKNVQEAVRRVMEEEAKYAKRNVNNFTEVLFFLVPHHYQCTKEICKREKRETNCFGIHAETIK